MELTHLKFSGKLFVNESLSHENQQLAYKCRKLKSARKIYSTWFYNNCVNIKLSEHSNLVKIFHVRDIENLMGTDNLEEFLGNYWEILRNSSSWIAVYFIVVVILLVVPSEAATRGVLWKKAFLEISQISWESTCFGVSFQLSCRPENLRLSCRVFEVFASSYFKESPHRDFSGAKILTTKIFNLPLSSLPIIETLVSFLILWYVVGTYLRNLQLAWASQAATSIVCNYNISVPCFLSEWYTFRIIFVNIDIYLIIYSSML